MPTKKALREASDALAEKTIAEIVKHFPAMKRRETAKPTTVANHLHGLLNAICWRKDLITKLGVRESFRAYEVFLREVTKDWTPEHHDEVVTYLEAGCPGGFPPPAILEERKKELSSKGEKEISSVLVDEMTDDQLLEALVDDLKPKAQLSPEHELDEIVAEAERQMNPTYKTW